jgi:hypothetical protein
MNSIFLIRHKKDRHLLGIGIYSNDGGEFCNATGARFEKVISTHDTPYVVMSREIAEQALAKNPEWFNSSISHPEWDGIDPTEYEVWEVKV